MYVLFNTLKYNSVMSTEWNSLSLPYSPDHQFRLFPYRGNDHFYYFLLSPLMIFCVYVKHSRCSHMGKYPSIHLKDLRDGYPHSQHSLWHFFREKIKAILLELAKFPAIAAVIFCICNSSSLLLQYLQKKCLFSWSRLIPLPLFLTQPHPIRNVSLFTGSFP